MLEEALTKGEIELSNSSPWVTNEIERRLAAKVERQPSDAPLITKILECADRAHFVHDISLAQNMVRQAYAYYDAMEAPTVLSRYRGYVTAAENDRACTAIKNLMKFWDL